MTIQQMTLDHVKRAEEALMSARQALGEDFKAVMERMTVQIMSQAGGLELDKHFSGVKEVARLAHEMLALEDRVKDIMASAVALMTRGAPQALTAASAASSRLMGQPSSVVVDAVVKPLKRKAKAVVATAKAATPAVTAVVKKAVAAAPKAKAPRKQVKVAAKAKDVPAAVVLTATAQPKAKALPLTKAAVKKVTSTAAAKATEAVKPKAQAKARTKPSQAAGTQTAPEGEVKAKVTPEPSIPAKKSRSAKTVAVAAKAAAEAVVPVAVDGGSLAATADKAKAGKPTPRKKVAAKAALSGNEAKVMKYLSGVMSKTELVPLVGREVAQGAGIPVGSVSLAIKKLVEKGHLVIGHAGGYQLG